MRDLIDEDWKTREPSREPVPKTPCSTSPHHVSPTHRESLSQTCRGVAGISTRAVECRHAQFRRHLFSTGVQTHARELAELSAVLLLDRASKCRNFSEVRGTERLCQPWVCHSYMPQPPLQTGDTSLHVRQRALEIHANRMQRSDYANLSPTKTENLRVLCRAADSITGRAFGRSRVEWCHRDASLAPLTWIEQENIVTLQKSAAQSCQAEEITPSWKLSRALRAVGSLGCG